MGKAKKQVMPQPISQKTGMKIHFSLICGVFARLAGTAERPCLGKPEVEMSLDCRKIDLKTSVFWESQSMKRCFFNSVCRVTF
jgi:hypothetical protein